MFNRTALLIVAVALAVGLGLVAAQRLFGPAQPAQPQLQAIKLFPQPREIPDFQLVQSDGTPLVAGELHGHWTLVFIGFTYCPDVCPMTLAQLKVAQQQWEALPETTRPRVLFVSVDPQRDTPERIGEYAHAFHRDTLAATGDLPALQAFTRSLSLVFMAMPPEDAERPDHYSVDHSASMAVLDPQGRMAGVLQPPLDPNAIAADLLKLSQPQ